MPKNSYSNTKLETPVPVRALILTWAMVSPWMGDHSSDKVDAVVKNRVKSQEWRNPRKLLRPKKKKNLKGQCAYLSPGYNVINSAKSRNVVVFRVGGGALSRQLSWLHSSYSLSSVKFPTHPPSGINWRLKRASGLAPGWVLSPQARQSLTLPPPLSCATPQSIYLISY